MGNFVWGMGQQLYPLHAPEFNPPRPFKRTLIIGIDNGQLINYEPMVTQVRVGLGLGFALRV